MLRYLVEINTDAYVLHRASKTNWEPGTVNDFMLELNGWHTVEHSLREVRWRIRMFQGQDWAPEEYSDDNPEENFGMSDRYVKWLSKKCNKIRFKDRLCGFEREHLPSGYGFMQGYLNVQKKITELKKKGTVRIYFEELYDIRQFDQNMKGCYMEIIRAN